MIKLLSIILVPVSILALIACTGSTTSYKDPAKINNKSAYSEKVYRRDDAVNCGLLDNKGVLWFGTNKNGLYRYDGISFLNISTENGLCSNTVNCIIQDSQGNILLGTPKGVCKYDGQNFYHLPIPWSDTSSVWLDQVYPIINPNEVHCLLEDAFGNLWIGTGGAGVYKYDGQTFENYLSDRGNIYDDGQHHNWITSITEDKGGTIWVTSMSFGAISRYREGSWTFIDTEDGLSDNMVRVSYEDSKGNIWFGSNGNRKGGLDRFDGMNFQNFNEAHGLCNSNTRCIYEDSKGNIWLGSGRGGLCVYDGREFKEVIDNTGNAFNSILFIVGDENGNIWFGGNYGKLYRYDGQKVKEFTQKR